MRLLYLLVWDAMFCIVLSISHFASATLISPDSSYIVTLITFAVCGVFLGHLPHVNGLTIVFVTLPALYLALAPFLAPILNTLPLPLPGGISLVPAALLSPDTLLLRYAGALTAGYTLWRKFQQ